MRINKTKKDDFEKVYLLLKELWPNDYLDKKKTKQLYLMQLSQGKTFFLAQENEVPLGMISFSERLDMQTQGKIGQIGEFIVTSSMRRKGLGKRLLKEVTALAKKRKYLELHLYSSKKRRGSHLFYRKNKFKDTAYYFWKEI